MISISRKRYLFILFAITFTVTLAQFLLPASVGLAQAQADHTLFVPGVFVDTTGEQTEDPPDVPDDELPPEIRAQAIDSIKNTLDELLPPTDEPVEGREPYAELEQMSDALLALPHVSATVLQTQTLSLHVILSDGLPITVIHNRPAGVDDLQPESAATPMQTQIAAQDSTENQATVASVPGSANAVAAYFDGGGSVRNEVAAMMGDAGFNVLGLGADIEAMRNYNNLGALYLDTHGASFLQVTDIQKNDDNTNTFSFGDSVYALQTSADVDVSTLRDQYLDDLRNGRVVVSMVETNQGWVAKLAITEQFIQEYWSFDDAIVMIHSCFGGANPFTIDGSCQGACILGAPGVFDPTPLRTAMLSKGARLVVAFDHLTNTGYARPSILYFFDRMLGADEYQPLSPPSRPFPWQQVRSAMDEAGLLSFTKPSFILGPFDFGGNNVNVTFTHGGDNAGMAPSIEKVDVVDDAAASEGEMTLTGAFGDNEGTVTLGGTTLAIQSWSNSQIVVDAPFDLSGDLIVKSPGNVESNPVPITRWSGQLTFSLQGRGTLRAESVFNIRFRADLHKFRTSLTDSPDTRTVKSYISGESSGETRGHGVYIDEDGDEIHWSGVSPMNVMGQPLIDIYADGVNPTSTPASPQYAAVAQTDDNFGGLVQLDPEANQAQLCLASWGTFLQQADNASMPTPLLLLGGEISGLMDSTRGILACVNLNMQSNYALSSGVRTATIEDLTYRLEWTRFEPESVPDNQTPG